MKKNEIIELNGVEYTLELKRDRFLQIDQLCNIQKSMDIIQRGLYKDTINKKEKIKDKERILRKQQEKSNKYDTRETPYA